MIDCQEDNNILLPFISRIKLIMAVIGWKYCGRNCKPGIAFIIVSKNERAKI